MFNWWIYTDYHANINEENVTPNSNINNKTITYKKEMNKKKYGKG